QSVDAPLPMLTRGLIALSDFMRDWGWLLGLGLVAGILAGMYALRRPNIKRAAQRHLLALPLLGRFIRGVNTARFTRTLAMLTRSGAPALDAMTIGADVISNLPMRTAVKLAAGLVRRQFDRCTHRQIADDVGTDGHGIQCRYSGQT